MMGNKREEIQVKMDKIKRQIEWERFQIRSGEYIWPSQMAGFKMLKRDLEEKLRILEEELTNE